jgi:hypothetical protein
MQKTQLQQGDVLLRRVTIDISKAEKVKRDKRGIVLAEGEVTGHFHGIENCEDAELIKIGEKMLLSVSKPVDLKHQEHGTITIEPGVWEVGGVVEYDYFQEMQRRVID